MAQKPKHRQPKKKSGAQQSPFKAPGKRAYIAPWRLSYILGPKISNCFFCAAGKLPEGDEAAWKDMLLLHRGPHGLVMLNRYPYTGGHLLIAPLRHTADLPGLSADESRYLWELSRHAVNFIAKTVQAQGYNMGMNLGKAAGAGVEEHLHMHALPRWHGDTNFMHVVANTSTVPVAIEKLWDEMRPLFKALPAEPRA